MGYGEIRAALIGGYTGLDLELDTAYENRPFTPGADPWASVFIVTNQPAVATLGNGGEDEHTGFMQVDLNYPLNAGTYEILSVADQLRGFFLAGRRLESGEQEVLITSCGRSVGVEVGGWYRISLTINWTARTTRSL